MRYKLKIQIGNNEPNFGKGVVELLELCDKYGSLSLWGRMMMQAL